MDKLLIINNADNMDLTDKLRQYQVEYADVIRSNMTTAAGTDVIDYAGTKVTVKCVLRMSDATEMKNILAALKSGNLNITYYDPQLGRESTIDAYPSATRNVSVYTASGTEVVYNEFAVDFVQYGIGRDDNSDE